MQDHHPAKLWIHFTVWGRQKFSEKRPTELFNVDEIILILPLFLLKTGESGWGFFLPHIPPHQCKTIETGEEILTQLWGLSPANVGLFTLLFTAHKTQHTIVYSQISFSSKVQMSPSKTFYLCFPIDKLCSHSEMDFRANHAKPYINKVKK